MHLEISTPALLFPAISLLFLSFTNRFLHLSSLIRHLHDDWIKNKEDRGLFLQISNLRKRLNLIKAMQLFGAVSLLCCVTAMLSVIRNHAFFAVVIFGMALGFMAVSLACLCVEVWISGGALRILLNDMEEENQK